MGKKPTDSYVSKKVGRGSFTKYQVGYSQVFGEKGVSTTARKIKRQAPPCYTPLPVGAGKVTNRKTYRDNYDQIFRRPNGRGN